MKNIRIVLPNNYAMINDYIGIINDKQVLLNEDDINNLLRIIRYWHNEYRNDKIISKEEYFITINTDDEEETINFNGSYPDDLYILLDFLGDLYDRK